MRESKTLTRDGLKLHRRSFPVSDPVALVCLVHGLGEHSGRYYEVAECFNQSKFQVETFDLRGHGLSEGQRGHVPRYEYLLDDIERVLQDSVADINRKLKIVLYGHSLGGNLVLNYVLNNQSIQEPRSITCDLLIATSPLLRPATDPPRWKIMFGQFVNHLLPRFSLDNGIDPAVLSSDQNIVAAYQADPLNHSRVSARLGISMLQQGNWALENAGLLNIPTLLMHGEADQLTSHGASETFAQRAGAICEFQSWPGLKHELHNELPELGRENVLCTMTDWILKNVKNSA